MNRTAATIRRLANRQIDYLIRQRILDAAGVEQTHPAWTTPKDSGLYKAMVTIANEILRDTPYVDGEDMVNELFGNTTRKVPILKDLGRVMGRHPHKFMEHPLQWMKPPEQFWKYWRRLAASYAETQKSRETILEDSGGDPSRRVKRPEDFWGFFLHVLERDHPLRLKLLRLARNVTTSRHWHDLISRVELGEEPRNVFQFTKDQGLSSAGGWHRKFKKFARAARELIQKDPELLAAYDYYLDRHSRTARSRRRPTG